METPQKDTQQKPWYRDALMMFARLSGWIVGPLVVALVVGKWLDDKFGTEPFIFVGLTVLAFVVAMGKLVSETTRHYHSFAPKEEDKAEESDVFENY